MKRVPLNPPRRKAIVRRTPLGVMWLVNNDEQPLEQRVFHCGRYGLDAKQTRLLLKIPEKEWGPYAEHLERGKVDSLYQVGRYMLSVGTGGQRWASREAVAAGTLVLKALGGWRDDGEDGAKNPSQPPTDEPTRRRKMAQFLKLAGAIGARTTIERVPLAPEPGTSN